MNHDTLTEAVKASPPVTVLAAHLAGYAISDVAAGLAVFYTLLLIGEKLYRWYQSWKFRKDMLE